MYYTHIQLTLEYGLRPYVCMKSAVSRYRRLNADIGPIPFSQRGIMNLSSPPNPFLILIYDTHTKFNDPAVEIREKQSSSVLLSQQAK